MGTSNPDIELLQAIQTNQFGEAIHGDRKVREYLHRGMSFIS